MLADELEKVLHCEIKREAPLSPLSTLGVGGRVECFLEPSRMEDFQAVFALRSREGFPLYILGGGSNAVFGDGRVPGVLLSTRRWNSSSWREAEDTVSVEVQAGHPLSSLVDEAARRGLGGLEFAIGIPGTVGGAVAGNAGAGGRSVGDLLTEVVTVEPEGALPQFSPGGGGASLPFLHGGPAALPEGGGRGGARPFPLRARHTAEGGAQRRVHLQEPGGKKRGAAPGRVRLQGDVGGGRRGLGAARELHPEPGACIGGGYSLADKGLPGKGL